MKMTVRLGRRADICKKASEPLSEGMLFVLTVGDIAVALQNRRGLVVIGRHGPATGDNEGSAVTLMVCHLAFPIAGF